MPRADANEDEDSVDDIESSIQKELESLGNKQGKPQMFCSVRLDIPCLLFFKTQQPIDPVEFVHRICEEIVNKPNIRRMRYINRLTPMSCIGKATEKGLEEVGKEVLGKHFQLSSDESRDEGEQTIACSVSVSFPLQTRFPRYYYSRPRSFTSLIPSLGLLGIVQGRTLGLYETWLIRSTRAYQSHDAFIVHSRQRNRRIVC